MAVHANPRRQKAEVGRPQQLRGQAGLHSKFQAAQLCRKTLSNEQKDETQWGFSLQGICKPSLLMHLLLQNGMSYFLTLHCLSVSVLHTALFQFSGILQLSEPPLALPASLSTGPCSRRCVSFFLLTITDFQCNQYPSSLLVLCSKRPSLCSLVSALSEDQRSNNIMESLLCTLKQKS